MRGWLGACRLFDNAPMKNSSADRHGRLVSHRHWMSECWGPGFLQTLKDLSLLLFVERYYFVTTIW